MHWRVCIVMRYGPNLVITLDEISKKRLQKAARQKQSAVTIYSWIGKRYTILLDDVQSINYRRI